MLPGGRKFWQKVCKWCGPPHVIRANKLRRRYAKLGWAQGWDQHQLHVSVSLSGDWKILLEDTEAKKPKVMNGSLTIIPEMFLYHLGPFPNVKCQTDYKNSGTSWAQLFFKNKEFFICECAWLRILRARHNLLMIFVCREVGANDVNFDHSLLETKTDLSFCEIGKQNIWNSQLPPSAQRSSLSIKFF